MFKIRKYKVSDAPKLRALFFNTIRNINIRDYSQEQVQAWAPEEYDHKEWLNKVISLNPFVVEKDGEVAAYADVQHDGYIDHFFCHKNYQGQGLGSMLMQTLITTAEQQNIPKLYAHVSITAKPFFLKQGFIVIKSQQVEVRKQVLNNFVMEMQLKTS